MGEILLFSVLGLGAGALIAGLGLGLVLSWRGSGAVNLAAGAMAMFVAYVYWAMRVEGVLFIPPFAIPLGGPLPAGIAMPLALLVAGLLGALLYGAVYRPLRHAPPLAKMVASAGVLLTLQALVVLRFGSDAKSVPDILPNGPGDVVEIAGIDVPINRILLAIVVLALAGALAATFRWTRFGISTTAAAENEKGAILVGLSPDRLSLVNWVLASVVSGAVGILAAPITQLDPLALTVAVIPALGAALLAKFSSFLVAAGAGLAIGVLQSLIVYLQTMPWFPTVGDLPLPGLSAGLPFLIIAAVMFLRGKSLPTRATAQSLRFPAAPRPQRVWLPASIAFFIAAVAIILLGPSWRQALIFSLIGAIVCLALVVVTGYIGQTSLLHMALAGTAGFVLARLTTDAGLPLWPSVGIAILASCLVGALASLPSVRVQGVNLAIITLAAAVAIQEIYFKNPVWAGGQAGATVPSPTIAGVGIGPADTWWGGDGLLPSRIFTLFCLLVTAAVALGVVFLRRSSLGQRMLAIRANERAAAAVGIGVTTTKLAGFTISAGIAGVAGVLYAFNFGSVTYTRFDAMTAIAFLAFAYLGGISTVSGALVGGVLATQGLVFLALQEWFGLDDRLTLLVAGVAVILTVVLNPDGITGVARDIGTRLRKIRGRRAVAGHAGVAVELGGTR